MEKGGDLSVSGDTKGATSLHTPPGRRDPFFAAHPLVLKLKLRRGSPNMSEITSRCVVCGMPWLFRGKKKTEAAASLVVKERNCLFRHGGGGGG